MATQRVTVAKLAGMAAGLVHHRLKGWPEFRLVSDPDEWSGDQWPPVVRDRVDTFVGLLRANAGCPPVVHFAERVDQWSMGDVFVRWLTPPEGAGPLVVYSDRFEVYGYTLPDDGRLWRYLAGAGPQQFPEYGWFVSDLKRAVGAWSELIDESLVLVIREVIGGLVTDEELAASLEHVPVWLKVE